MRRRVRFGYAVAAFSAAYYLGAQVGLDLTPRAQPVSTLWPPNAILLGALLLAPARAWPVLLAAALPAHLASELDAGVPMSMVLSWFVSNCFEALLGAAAVRAFIDRPVRLDTVRRVAIFVAGAGLLAPFLSSFVDAAFVQLNDFGTQPYWVVFRVRLFSNVLAILTIVPAMVTWGNLDLGALHATRRRIAEAVLLTVTIFAACLPMVWNFGLALQATPALLFAPLPLLLWAAVRFGPAATSAGFLIIAVMSDVAAINGVGPFYGHALTENVLSLQMYLILTYVPLMVLTAVLRERERDAIILRHEATFRESAARLRELADAMPQIVFSAAPDGHIEYFNQKWYDYAGGEGEPIIDETWLSVIHPADREGCLELWRANVAAGEPHDHEARFRCVRTGHYRWHLVRALPMRDAHGAILRFYGTATDIDEHKRTEEALRRSEAKLRLLHEELEHRVIERTEELSLANANLRGEIEERVRAKQALHTLERQLTHMGRVAVLGELSAALAHELNQPLTAILANARAAQRLLMRDTADLKEIRAILDDIVTDDLRAGSVIRRVRALIRKGDSDLQPLAMNEIVSEVLDLAHSDLILREVQMMTRLGTSLPLIAADRVQLQQVVLNLIVNACDAMAEIPPSDRLITITTKDEGSAVRLSVSDRGTGITDDSVFEPFVTSKQDGLGLGLAICRSIVDSHGGRMWTVNNAERGATFHLLLPRMKETPPPDQGLTVQYEPRRAKSPA